MGYSWPVQTKPNPNHILESAAISIPNVTVWQALAYYRVILFSRELSIQHMSASQLCYHADPPCREVQICLLTTVAKTLE
jgi:hypothetical protein